MSFVEITAFPKRLLPLFLGVMFVALLLVGCQLVQAPNASVETAVEASSVAETARETNSITETAPLTISADLSASVSLTDALPPVLLRIPEIDLALPIETMGWVVTEVNGQRTTEWVIPTDAIGWHANSAGAGGAGNTVLSGYQAAGGAILAPLALGDITVEQAIELVDTAGNVFRYRVVEVSDPIPLLGATEVDNTLMHSYVQPSEAPLLTLMTGWPDFTTTHRIFAVAEYVGRAP